MVNRVLLKKLVRDLVHRKGALSALLVIVAIGVGCFTGMASVYRDMDGSRERYYRDHRLADFTVDLKRAPQGAVDSLTTIRNVKAVRGRVNYAVRIDLPNVEKPITGSAISVPEERRPVLNDLLLRSGSWFSGVDDNETLLNDAFAKANGLKPGDRIHVLLLDKEHDLLVVGTAMSPEFVYLIPESGGLAPDPARFGVLYLTEDFLQKSCGLDGAYNQILGLAHQTDRTSLENMLQRIEEEMDPYGVLSSTPIEDQASVRFLSDELKGVQITSRTMPVIFLGVAALVLNILMGRLVTQQRSIIGTLRALGYSSGDITRHFLGFGVVIGLIGGVLGNGLGIWLQTAMGEMYKQFFALPTIDAHFYPGILLFGFVFSIGFAIAGTLKGVKAAARLQPAEAMRPAPPEKGGSVFPERISFLWRILSFKWKLILRTIFRNPFRSTVSVFASFISTAIVLSTLSSVDALNYIMEYQYERMSHEDFSVSLRDPRDSQSPLEVGDMKAMSFTEPQLNVACDFSNGPYRKRAAIIGMPSNSVLSTPLDDAGDPIRIPDSGVVLTRKLAELLDLRIGNTVEIRPLIGRRERVRVVVSGIVDSYLGLSAYSDIAFISRLLGEEWAANVVLGTTFDRELGNDTLAAIRERPSVVGLGERRRSFVQMEETFGKQMRTNLSIVVLFAGLIAFGSVLNAVLVSLSERRREVGTLRVLGYTSRQVSRIFSGESTLLNGLGVALGVLGGIALSYALSAAYSTELYRFPAVILPVRVIHSVLIVAAFIALAQWIVARIITQLDWLEVLKIKE